MSMEEMFMIDKLIKYYSKSNSNVAIHAAPGHFVTMHSHINYYIDLTSLKTRLNEAEAVAEVIATDYAPNTTIVDTIVCMDGTEVIGACLAREFRKRGFFNNNLHETIYVVSPEYNSQNQIIFRDNNLMSIRGKNIILLLATTTTGETIRRAVECIDFYGGKLQGISSLFSIVEKVDGNEIHHVFTKDDLPGYHAWPRNECPLCQKGFKVEAIVNGFGFSKL